MSATLIPEPRTWKVVTDDDGYTIYSVAWLVKTTETMDGPAIVLKCPGLPAAGSRWNFGNDVDNHAHRLPSQSCSIHDEKEGDPNVWWKVEQTFSTKLFSPARFKGNFKNYTKEALTDRHGRYILTSSWEQIRGPQVEFDQNRPFIQAEQDVFQLELPLLSSMVDTVNKGGVFSFNSRCVKLSNFDWDQHILMQNASAIGNSSTSQEASPSLITDPLLNEKQVIDIQGNPTGGTFTLHWKGLTTIELPWNAEAADVSAALVAVFGANFTVTGGPFPTAFMEVEFTGAYAVMDSPLIGINTSGLTGGFKDENLYYYTRRFEFDIDTKTFDRKVLDEGTKALSGQWQEFTKSSEAFGAGCRLILTASEDGGGILEAVVAEEPVSQGYLSGFGYPIPAEPPSPTRLRVIGGGGTGGIVEVTITALGRVDTEVPITIVEAGSGYSTTSQLFSLTFPGAEGLNFYTVETVQVSPGCTVSITTKNGANVGLGPSPVIGVTLLNGGSGYPANQKIRMTLTFNALEEEVALRIPCIITGTVNGLGAVTAVDLVDGGDGYYPHPTDPPMFGAVVLRTVYSADQWRLKAIGGRMPDPNNPQHFERYQDRQGNYARVVLDGQGVPAKSIVFREGTVKVSGDPAHILVEFYPESDFLKLGLGNNPAFNL